MWNINYLLRFTDNNVLTEFIQNLNYIDNKCRFEYNVIS